MCLCNVPIMANIINTDAVSSNTRRRQVCFFFARQAGKELLIFQKLVTLLQKLCRFPQRTLNLRSCNEGCTRKIPLSKHNLIAMITLWCLMWARWMCCPRKSD